MSEVARRKSRKNIHFWRAARHLIPYRGMVIISIVTAFFVGGIFTSGLGAMMPILQILINGDTVQNWIDRKMAEQRLAVTLVEDAGIPRLKGQLPESPLITRVNSDSITQKGVAPGWHINVPLDSLSPLALFADPQVTEVTVSPPADGPSVKIPLAPAKFHMVWAHSLSGHISRDPVKAIATVFGFIAVLAIFANVIRFFQEYLSDKAAISAVNDVRRRLYDHVLQLPLRFFGVSGTSDVTSRLVQDAQSLQEGFKMMLGQFIQAPITAAFAFGLSLYVSWELTLLIGVFAPIMAITLRKFGKKMRRAGKAALQQSGTMLGQIEGSLIGIRVVKASNAERFERRKYTRILSVLRVQQLKMALYEAYSTPALELISLMVFGVILIMASYMILVSRTLDKGDFIMVMACLVSIAEPVRRLTKLTSVFARSDAAAARIFEILDLPIERRRKDARQDAPLIPLTVLPPIKQEVRFENLTFSYPNASAPAVIDVNLTVPRGKAIAVVGPNGSGKTTLMALLPRFYDPDAGRITIDGVDIRNATLRSLRDQISVVTQDSVIFCGTVAENIAYGHPLAPRLSEDIEPVRALRKQIESAARQAFAHDFIMEKPLGYDAMLDGFGGQLSGGQKQRLNIARAILRQTPLLILDEATSQVDAESEHLIQQAIEALMHERTTFVIAHRFSTIIGADRIVVMDRGRIVGQGLHDELLKTCPTYQKLYERQLVGGG